MNCILELYKVRVPSRAEISYVVFREISQTNIGIIAYLSKDQLAMSMLKHGSELTILSRITLPKSRVYQEVNTVYFARSPGSHHSFVSVRSFAELEMKLAGFGYTTIAEVEYDSTR